MLNRRRRAPIPARPGWRRTLPPPTALRLDYPSDPTPVTLRLALLLLPLAALSACGPSHRLADVSLDGQRVAVAASIPPSPRVQAGSPAETAIDLYDPIGSAVRVGTSASKARAARAAQVRLDSVVARVDVSDRIARQVLAGSARALQFAPAQRPSDAGYLIDLRVVDYALVADSFDGDVFFVLQGDVTLSDPSTGRVFWHTELAEREVLDGTFFVLPAAIGNVITGRALAQLSGDEMAAGLVRLADFTARRIVDRFVRDYRGSRDDYAKRRAG